MKKVIGTTPVTGGAAGGGALTCNTVTPKIASGIVYDSGSATESPLYQKIKVTTPIDVCRVTNSVVFQTGTSYVQFWTGDACTGTQVGGNSSTETNAGIDVTTTYTWTTFPHLTTDVYMCYITATGGTAVGTKTGTPGGGYPSGVDDVNYFYGSDITTDISNWNIYGAE
jgi:hypothetical protein